MAIGVRYYTPNPFEVDPNGVPLAGAQLFFFATGTGTPQDTFQDVGLTVPNTNPVIADANGRFGSVWLIPSNAYAVELWTAPTDGNPTGSQIWAADPVGPASGGAPTNVVGIVGEVRAFAGTEDQIPAGWYECYGQAVSRTTYAAGFAVLGTTWGAGDASTTFNLPDLRGRALFGKDDMGSVAASRLTAGVSGVSGNTLGASGGDQATQTHNHALSDPGHTHTLTDPGHSHEERIMRSFTGGGVASGGVSGASNPVDANMATLSATTGITIASNTTGVTIANYGAGSSQNIPPAAVVFMIIYLGA